MEDVPKILPNTATLTRPSASADASRRRVSRLSGSCRSASRSSIVGSAARSRSTARAKSSGSESCSVATTRSYRFRRSRRRARRASEPIRRPMRGHSAATTSAAAASRSATANGLTGKGYSPPHRRPSSGGAGTLEPVRTALPLLVAAAALAGCVAGCGGDTSAAPTTATTASTTTRPATTEAPTSSASSTTGEAPATTLTVFLVRNDRIAPTRVVVGGTRAVAHAALNALAAPPADGYTTAVRERRRARRRDLRRHGRGRLAAGGAVPPRRGAGRLHAHAVSDGPPRSAPGRHHRAAARLRGRDAADPRRVASPGRDGEQPGHRHRHGERLRGDARRRARPRRSLVQKQIVTARPARPAEATFPSRVRGAADGARDRRRVLALGRRRLGAHAYHRSRCR